MEKLKGSIKAFNVYHTDAYMIAVKNGFEGTEAEWLESLKLSPEETEIAVNKYLTENPVAIDKTLSVSGEAADAKVTGEKFAELQAKAEENQTAVNTHTENKENPHGVTAEQVGLGNVDNTSDMDKPVSTAQAQAITDAKKAGTDAQTAAENAQTAADNAQTAADNAQTDVDAHIADHNNPHGVTTAQIGAQAQHQNKVITLFVSNWSSKQQTVSVAGLDKDDTVFSTPDADSSELYSECNVKLKSQGSGTLTYVCEEVPSANLTINVTYFPVGGTGVTGGGSTGGASGGTSGGGDFVQVQSDWNQTDTTASDYIKNKPNFVSDWNQTDSSAADFIKNKPFVIVNLDFETFSLDKTATEINQLTLAGKTVLLGATGTPLSTLVDIDGNLAGVYTNIFSAAPSTSDTFIIVQASTYVFDLDGNFGGIETGTFNVSRDA